jgi:protein-tyrosine phosphatase
MKQVPPRERKLKILFVCLGNICRSPTAEAVLRGELAAAGLDDRVTVESAGTGDWHAGEPPDARAVAAARRRGIAMDGQVARQVRRRDFAEFDLILAMDRQNLADLRRIAPPGARARLALFLDYAPQLGLRDVPDPYMVGGFDEVVQIIAAAGRGLLAEVRARLAAP